MAKKGKKTNKLDTLYGLLAGVDETYGRLPLNMRLAIEKISRGLTEFGPRKLHRRGTGTEFFESRDFQPDIDDPKKINARLSARAGKNIVIEKEAEIRQHFYLWRDGTASMEYGSDDRSATKKQAAEIMLLAFAKHLAKNEEMIGILGGQGVYRGGKASERLAEQLIDVTIVTGDRPVMTKKLPRNSTVVLFSDFLMDPGALVKWLDQLTGASLKGYLVMVLDPQELEFRFKGHVEFEGMEGEGKKKFKKTETMKDAYQEKMEDHIRQVEKLCKAKGFKFILQRTDEPLHNGLLAIYGLSPKVPARTNLRGPVGPGL